MAIWRGLINVAKSAGDFFALDEGCDCEALPGRLRNDAGLAVALIGLGAKLARADGHVTDREIKAFRDLFQAPAQLELELARIFQLAQQTTLGFESYARRVARRYRACPALLEDVLDGLFHIAWADGAVTDDEIAFIAKVAEIFGLSEREFLRLRASHGAADRNDPYVVLGLDADADMGAVRRAYRRLATENHPDRLAARGVPEELWDLAHEKMAAINAAYSQIMRAQRALADTP
ncbi:MAG: TerB family tellurite resistance protein [Maricaulaceae bacterium]